MNPPQGADVREPMIKASHRHLRCRRAGHKRLHKFPAAFAFRNGCVKYQISPETVKTHVKNLFTKLDVDRRAQAVARAQMLGLI